jgi:hypothetical protein
MNDNTRTAITIGVVLLILWKINDLFADPGVNMPVDRRELTLSDADLQAMVNAFYGLAWTQGGPLWEDEAAMTSVILLCNTTADLAAFANRYGRRSAWYGTDMDIFTTVRSLFSEGEVNDLNAKLTEKGITIRF